MNNIASALAARKIVAEAALISAVEPVLRRIEKQIIKPKLDWLEHWNVAKEVCSVGNKTETLRHARFVHQLCPSFFWADNIWKHPFGYFSQDEQDFAVEAFFDLVPPANRFFVDVGAFDPHFLSNSRRLIRKGWGGIVIEPSPGPAERQMRCAPPNVEVVQCAVGAGPGTVTLYETQWPGMPAGGAIACVKEQQVSRGLWRLHPSVKPSFVMPVATHDAPIFLPEPTPVEVECRTLDSILGNCPHIDVMFVDIELSESNMFAGFSLEAYLPTLIIIETVTAEVHERLMKAGYVHIASGASDQYYAHKDVLNRSF